MAYLKNWAEVLQVIEDNNAKRFKVSRAKNSSDDNMNVFMYNSELSDAENKQIAERLLQRCAGDILYLTCWRSENARTGGCSYAIMYDGVQGAAQQGAAQVQGVGLYGAGNAIDVEKLTADIEARVMTRYERERLDAERKQLDAERKAFDAEKASSIGLIVQKLAPVAQALMRKNLPQVAGMDTEEPVHSHKIQPISEREEEEENPFTDEEEEKIFDLMDRFKKKEPRYLELLESVVTMAENGDQTYEMAKNFLLK